MKTIKLIENTTKIVLLAMAGIVLNGEVFAQQTPISNFYNFNEYLLNPAEAGFKDKLYGTASHRIQWQGLEGAPTSTFFGIHGMLNEKMGLGGKIVVDQTDILKQFNAALSYAYRIRLNEKARLNFGVSGQVIQNSISFGDAVVGNLADEVVNGGDESGVNFDAEAGIMLEYGKAKLGIASSHLFQSGVDYNIPDNNGTGTFERIRQFNAYGSYEFGLSENWTLEPFAIVRNQGVESFQLDVNALAAWKETLYLGAGYRQEAGYIGRVGFQVTDQLIAAYAYEFSNTGVASFSNGSHEFMLGYRIKNKKKVVEKPMAEEKIPMKKEEEKIMEEKLKKEEKVIKEVPEQVKEVIKETPPTPPTPPVKEVVKETTPTPPAPPVKKEEDIALEDLALDIKFEYATSDHGNSTIDKDPSLEKVAAYLAKNPSKKVRIEGHTCDLGNDEVNTRYSLQRANTVKAYLLKKGVKESQMEIKAVLDKEPLLPNNSEENRRQNRRVELEIID